MIRFLQDILRQPDELQRVIAHLCNDGRRYLDDAAAQFRGARHVNLTGIGSSWHSSQPTAVSVRRAAGLRAAGLRAVTILPHSSGSSSYHHLVQWPESGDREPLRSSSRACGVSRGHRKFRRRSAGARGTDSHRNPDRGGSSHIGECVHLSGGPRELWPVLR